MSQDIEIDPDSRTITYYEKPTVESIKEHLDAGGLAIGVGQARALLDEIDRLRKLVPPETERGPGFVGQGSWSVFAEKVVEERDAAREQIKYFIAQRQGLEAEVNRLCDNIRSLCTEKEEAQERVKQHLEEKIELRDELSALCEEIRCLKEAFDDFKEESAARIQGLLRQNSELHRVNAGLQEEVTRCGTALASKKEHTNTHFNDKKDFVGIDGYGHFSVQKANDCLWILKLPNETVSFYNRKGRRVCANHVHSGDM